MEKKENQKKKYAQEEVKTMYIKYVVGMMQEANQDECQELYHLVAKWHYME